MQDGHQQRANPHPDLPVGVQGQDLRWDIILRLELIVFVFFPALISINVFRRGFHSVKLIIHACLYSQ